MFMFLDDMIMIMLDMKNMIMWIGSGLEVRSGKLAEELHLSVYCFKTLSENIHCIQTRHVIGL
jgi:hypothetical protein